MPSFVMRQSIRRRNQRQATNLHKPRPVATLGQAPDRNWILLERGKIFVLIFNVKLRHVPSDITITPESGGSGQTENKTSTLDFPRFSNVRVDLPSLLARCSVNNINVRSQGDYCRVYVNCTAGTEDDIGFNHWSGHYEKFVTWAMMRTWGKLIQRENGGRMSLDLRNISSDGNTKQRIFFKL